MAGLNGDLNGVAETPPDAPRSAAGGVHGDDAPSRPIDSKSAAQAEAQLSQELSAGYRPNLPIYSTNAEHLYSPQFFLDIEPMRLHPAIHLPLMYRLGAVAHPEWKLEGSDPDVVAEGSDLIQWFWSNAVGRLYEEGCCYGYSAGEVVYEVRDGLLAPKTFKPFSSRGTQPLLSGTKPVGVAVQSSYGSEALRLWAFRESVPNKAVWYTHNASHGGRYGRSALRPVWRPWRRLSGRDGAEEIADLAMYRYGTGFVKTFYPPVDQKVGTATRPKTADGDGRVSGRDSMRQMGEQIKAGGAINLPSVFDGKGNRLWDVEFETPGTNLQDILAYLEALESMCARGLGVPPELIEAAETGSGYSGRMIPLESFLTEQQQYVNDLTRTALEQLILPIIRWNRGPKAWLKATAKPLTETFKKRAGTASGPQRDPSGHFAALPQQAPPMPPEPGTVGMATDSTDIRILLPSLTLAEMYSLEAALEADDE
jgi:hypothetical protein